MPPSNRSVADLARETGITESTLYNWRKEARTKGLVVPGKKESAEQWSSANKFNVVLETAALSEAELSEYCRAKGLYVEQVKRWRAACEQANVRADATREMQGSQQRQDKKRIKQLERELNRKEKALAEAAALLVLRKKLAALWGEDEDV